MNGFESATSLKAMLEKKEVSAREALELYLQRIERHNPELNLVVALDAERARAQARTVDDARARGEALPPLAGLPITVKDAFETEGLVTTCGIPDLRSHVPHRDAEPVARLKAAGAIVFGKTNLPMGAADWQSYNPVYGRSNNPWNVERTVGGSSGGSAGAIAAGFSALELGSDIAGSIRVPSHFCGVFGHKPSHNIIPLRGHIPPPPGLGYAPVELAVCGPIARSAADLQLALGLMAGPSDVQALGWRLALPPPRGRRLAEFRVAVFMGDETFTVDSAYRSELEAFVEDVRRAGARVTAVTPPFDSGQMHELFLRSLFAVVGSSAPQDAAAMAAAVGKDETGYAARLAPLYTPPLAAWFELRERREHLFRAFKQFFEDYDVLLCPAAVVVAFPHMTEGASHADQLSRRLSVSGRSASYFDNFAWPGVAVVANLPATAAPTGRFVGGLPAGVQVIGPYLEDYTPIAFAQAAEEAIGGFEAPPLVSR